MNNCGSNINKKLEAIKHNFKPSYIVVNPSSSDVTINVGKTTTGSPGTNASVTNVGTNKNVVLDFVIPQGVQGDIPDIKVGNVTTGNPGTEASVIIKKNI